MYSTSLSAPPKRCRFCWILNSISFLAASIFVLATYVSLGPFTERTTRQCFMTTDGQYVFEEYVHNKSHSYTGGGNTTHYSNTVVYFKAQNTSVWPSDAPVYDPRVMYMIDKNWDCTKAKGIRDMEGTSVPKMNYGIKVATTTHARGKTANTKSCFEWLNDYNGEDYYKWDRDTVNASIFDGTYSNSDFLLLVAEKMRQEKVNYEKFLDDCFPPGEGRETECCANFVATGYDGSVLVGVIGGVCFFVKVLFDLIFVIFTGGSKARVNADTLQLEPKSKNQSAQIQQSQTQVMPMQVMPMQMMPQTAQQQYY